jgi:hypothetical protein
VRPKTAGIAATLVLVAVLAISAMAGLFAGEPGEPVEMDAPLAAIDGERIRVEVLNGAGVSGLARDVTRMLRDLNFDVVFYGNAAGGAQDSSVVLDRTGNADHARRVADALDIAAVRSEPDSTLYLEATVILGADWRERLERAATPDSVPSGR